MEEEHSCAAKGVRPVWSPSEAAAEREAKRRSLYSTYMNFRPVMSTFPLPWICQVVSYGGADEGAG
jgi:hypothetical protein